MKFSYNKQRKVFVCSHLGEVIDTDPDWVTLRSRHGMVADGRQADEWQEEEQEEEEVSTSRSTPYSEATVSATWTQKSLGESY